MSILAERQQKGLIFSPLKRVVKGHCSCRPWRERIHTKPEKVKGKCIREAERIL